MKGVVLSIRNLSTVALVVPESGTIEWLQTGPWLNQHDVNDLGDGRFSIFGNDSVRPTGKILENGYSEIYVFTPAGKRVEMPYTKAMTAAGVRALTEGLVTVLDNGDAFVEESTRDRLLRISREGVRWEYVSPAVVGTTGALHWSRHLPRPSVDLRRIKERKYD